MTRGQRLSLLVAVALPCVMWLSLVLCYEPAFWSLVFDDSYYYWQIAKQLAAGNGSTFDGLHQTNGYHPLWLGVCTLFFSFLEGERAILATIAAQLVLFSCAWFLLGVLLSGALRDCPHRSDSLLLRAIPVIVGLSALVHPLLQFWVNGLESTLSLLFQIALLAHAARGELLEPAASRGRIAAGLLIAGAFLARTDAALLLPCIALWALPELIRQPRQTARALCEWLLIPTIVVIGFMIANQRLFGSAIQVSGLLKGAPLGFGRILAALAIAGACYGLPRSFPAAAFPRATRLLRRAGFFGLFAAVLCGYYGALQLFPRLWYFGPIMLVLVSAGATGMLDLLALAVDQRRELAPRAAVRPLVVIFGIVTCSALAFGFWRAASAPGAAPMLANRAAGLHVASRLPPGAVLASWDAGVVGFYAQRPVVNLDGVVNSATYLAALRAGTTAELLSRVPIGWIVNHARSAGGERDLRRRASALLGTRADGMRLVKTWPFTVFGGVNRLWPTSNVMRVYLFQLAGRR